MPFSPGTYQSVMIGKRVYETGWADPQVGRALVTASLPPDAAPRRHPAKAAGAGPAPARSPRPVVSPARRGTAVPGGAASGQLQGFRHCQCHDPGHRRRPAEGAVAASAGRRPARRRRGKPALTGRRRGARLGAAKGRDMAGGWARDGAVSEQIEASIADELQRMKSRRAAIGDSFARCADCDEPIPDARRGRNPRREALPRLRLGARCPNGAARRDQPAKLQGQPVEIGMAETRTGGHGQGRNREGAAALLRPCSGAAVGCGGPCLRRPCAYATPTTGESHGAQRRQKCLDGRLYGDQPDADDAPVARDTLGLRLLYVILIWLMLNVAQTVLRRADARAIRGNAGERWRPERARLADFGTDLGIWVAKAARYQAGASEVKPWPWSELD